MGQMTDFIGGALTLGYLIAGLFFLRFWKVTRDRLFAVFSVSFWLLALNRLALTGLSVADENLPYVYLPRLLAFVLIIAAIADKNRLARGA
jgi:hypothetical protein